MPPCSRRSARSCAVFERAAIIGTGLIGGSVAAALKRAGLARHVAGYSRSDGVRAHQAGLIDSLAGDPVAAVAGADLVVLAAPVSVNAALFETLADGIVPDAVVTELSSVKAGVAQAASAALGMRLPRYVPTHPIAGGERRGPDAADAALFDGRLVIISPLVTSARDAVERLELMWQRLGARTRRLDVSTHDELYALVSHWPHAAAYAMAAGIASRLRDDGGDYVGPGLRDMTRIAASDPGLWADIVLANAGRVLDCAEDFQRELDRIRAAIATGDREALMAAFSRGAQWRRSLPPR